MPIDKINGVNLYWELTGTQGEPLVFVHGSWGDHNNWSRVAGELSKQFRILTYDRRGHSQSERFPVQGNADEDVADLVALIEFLGLGPAHIIGNSGGAAVVLKAAAGRPDLFRTLVAHEPALFGLLGHIPEAQPMLKVVNERVGAVVGLIEKGDSEAAAKLFVETIAFGPGAWQGLPPEAQKTFVYNAPTFLDETRDPGSLQMDLSGLSGFTRPALLTRGTASAPFFALVVEQVAQALPAAHEKTLEGAGHVPHLSHPEQYIELVKAFCFEHAGTNQDALAYGIS